MTKKKTKVKRQPISKTLRFEVFKRDKFTCMYCGRKAPDVILQVDHLTPVAEGGTNDIMNLVTSCVDCNLGKGARPLSEETLVAKQRAQAEALAERREQIEMLRDWHLELARQDNLEVETVADYFIALVGGKYRLTDEYKERMLLPLVKKYGMSAVIAAMQGGMESYQGDRNKMLEKLGGICACNADPALNRRVRLLNRMAKVYEGFDRIVAGRFLQRGWEQGGEIFLDYITYHLDEGRHSIDWWSDYDFLLRQVEKMRGVLHEGS